MVHYDSVPEVGFEPTCLGEGGGFQEAAVVLLIRTTPALGSGRPESNRQLANR